MSENHDRPTTNKPLHGPRRPRFMPYLAVLGLLVVVAVIFLALTWAQQNT